MPASDQSGVPADSSSPVGAVEAQGSSRRAAGNAEPSAETAGAAAQVPFTAAAGGQASSTASAKSARPPVSAKGDVHQANEGSSQAKGGVAQAKGEAPQTKGDSFQAKGGGAQHPANAAGDDTKPEQQQALSSTAQPPIGDGMMAALQETDQHQEQPKAKTPVKRVRVVRYHAHPGLDGVPLPVYMNRTASPEKHNAA